jgi:hypothetical protein
MSTGLIIAIIVVAVLIVAAAAFVLPRMRERARLRARERELGERRDEAATQLRQEAEARSQRAQAAEQRARMAELEARRERAEAELHSEQAAMTERGLADHQLISDDERDRFAGTSAVPAEGEAGAVAGTPGEASVSPAGREGAPAQPLETPGTGDPSAGRDVVPGRGTTPEAGDAAADREAR